MHPTENRAESVQGVVLAGGDSTRFEAGDKALATVDSQPIVGRILDVVAQTTSREPAIAVRTDAQRARYASAVDRSVRFVFDVPDSDGPLAGIVGAATTLDARWLFCCGCDMPLLDPTAVSWMIDQLPTAPTNSHPTVDAVAFEQPTGMLEPLHTLYCRPSVIELQRTLPRTAGPRQLLSELETVQTITAADLPADIPLERSTTNVNTVDELEAVESH